ncbi:MAG: molybdopterin-guanine dinucleotide biosynthesis protein B [Magnetococcales bacterium]|nr:molybdopterin-guanine dinucleotide biosynthesis protein B [Magnetococcales bacterium]
MIPVMGFAAPSGSGKTTLMERVIADLKGRGLRIAALKHGHHPAEPDIPGKDSHRFRQAGAETVLFAGPGRWFLIQEREPPPWPELLALLQDHDLILVEGYADGPFPRIAIHRRESPPRGEPRLISGLVAVATDDPALETDLPRLPLNDPAAVGDFILRHLGLMP